MQRRGRTRPEVIEGHPVFLRVGRGSLFEVETQIIISSDLEYIDSAKAKTLGSSVLDVIRLLNGLMRHHEKLLSTGNCQL